MRESKVTIKIPRPLYRKVEHVVANSGFHSPTEFIVYVLRDLMAVTAEKQPTELATGELSMLKKKLEKLGYL